MVGYSGLGDTGKMLQGGWRPESPRWAAATFQPSYLLEEAGVKAWIHLNLLLGRCCLGLLPTRFFEKAG
jgi:hypothetical protein